MAYYSTVVIILNKNIIHKYTEILKDIQNIYNISINEIIIKQNNDAICYYINKCKWYEYALENKLASFINEKDYLFIRLGTEYSDINIEGNFWENSFSPKIITKIDINIDFIKKE